MIRGEHDFVSPPPRSVAFLRDVLKRTPSRRRRNGEPAVVRHIPGDAHAPWRYTRAPADRSGSEWITSRSHRSSATRCSAPSAPRASTTSCARSASPSPRSTPPGRSTCRPPSTRCRSGRTSCELAARNVTVRAEDVLPRGRRVRPLHPRRRRRAGEQGGVPDRLLALPAGGVAGVAPGVLRVPDDAVPAHRHGGGQRLALRRRARGGRGRGHGAQRDRQAGGHRQRGRPPALPRRAARPARRPAGAVHRDPAEGRRGRHDGARGRARGRHGRHRLPVARTSSDTSSGSRRSRSSPTRTSR